MTNRLLQTILISLLLAAPHITKICKEWEALGLNEDFKEECYSCGKNCSTCLLMGDNIPQCFYCKDGFYLKTNSKGKAQCKACVEGCRVCIGPETADCEQMEDFYYYNEGLEKLEKCDESC